MKTQEDVMSPWSRDLVRRGSGSVLAVHMQGEGCVNHSWNVKPGDEPYLSPNGGALCDCEEGKERYRGKCEALFTVSICNDEDVLVPEDFMREKNCPNQFSCKEPDKCPGFIKVKRELGEAKGEFDTEIKKFLTQLKCKRNSRRICCPDYDQDSLLLPITMIRSLNDSKAVKCMKNPCLVGSFPWRGHGDVSVCKKAESHIVTCKEGIEEDEGGTLTCKTHSEIALNSLTSQKKNCGRRRSWRYGRCVRVFRGK